MTHRIITAAMLALVLSAAPEPGAAQRAPAFGGAELRAGVVFPERAVAGAGVMGEVDLGYVWRPELRVIAGLSHFRANIDREPGNDEGSFGATGIWLSGRYDLFARRTTGAYVRAGLTLQSVSADAWDSEVDALLSGTNVGAAIAVGARRNLDASGRIGGTFEVRRMALNNIGGTAVEIGVRMLTRGAAAYTPVLVAQSPVRPRTDAAVVDRVAATPPPAVPPASDTASIRRAAEQRAAVADLTERQAVAAAAERDERRAREAAMDERRADDAAAERAAAAEALLRQGLTRSAAAMRSVTGMRETPATFVVTLSGTAFASGATTLAPSARRELRVLATVLAGYPGHIVSVEGHTDAVGNDAANLALSLERANAVRAALIVEGVDPLWTGVRSFGSARPVSSNDTAAGRAANRRVEIHVMRQPCAVPPRPGPDGGPVCPARP